MRFTFRKIAYCVLGVYCIITCYTGFLLLKRRAYTSYSAEEQERFLLSKIKSLSGKFECLFCCCLFSLLSVPVLNAPSPIPRLHSNDSMDVLPFLFLILQWHQLAIAVCYIICDIIISSINNFYNIVSFFFPLTLYRKSHNL